MQLIFLIIQFLKIVYGMILYYIIVQENFLDIIEIFYGHFKNLSKYH